MKQINTIDLFNRQEERNKFVNFLDNFSIDNIYQSKGIYVLGPSGVGKTTFVKNILREKGFDMVVYDAGDSRTKQVIGDIIGPKLSNCNIMDMFNKKKRKIAIVMDEMDYMNVGDKGGIKEMIKYIRPKKTRKQMKEPQTTTPIIFIGTNNNDKKIKELINVSEFIELSIPSDDSMREFIQLMMPDIEKEETIREMINYAGGNLHKLEIFYSLYENKREGFDLLIKSITHKFNYNAYTKSIVKELYRRYIPISEYNQIVKETDRTTLGLLWHENLSSIITDPNNFKLYDKILDNLCLSDYIDRIIFQNQIWQLSEQNSFIKTFYNNYLLHQGMENIKVPSEIIFTKVLTKYSTEYNNFLFLQQLEQKTFLDKKELLHLFLNKREEELKEDFYLSDLDVDRMKRFLVNGEFTCA